MLAALAMLAALPLLSKRPAGDFEEARPGHEAFFFGLLLCYLVLADLGSLTAAEPFVSMAQLFAIGYFVAFVVPSAVRLAGPVARAIAREFGPFRPGSLFGAAVLAATGAGGGATPRARVTAALEEFKRTLRDPEQRREIMWLCF